MDIFLSCHSDTVNTIQNTDIIAIQPLEDPRLASITKLSQNLTTFYGCKVIILPGKPLPNNAFYGKRQRYRADSLLILLEQIKPDTIHYIIGLTDKDISATTNGYKDWGVFGYGQCPGVSNIISTFRLRKNASNTQIDSRLKNVAIHEIGHNLGLPHCADTTYIMKDANGKLSSIEGNSRYLCKRCQLKTQKQ